MNLHDVNRGIHKHRKTKRLGRGPGSGQGKTAGRGNKGQGQLAGWTAHPAFEGGQMPLFRRLPKRGFNNRWAAVVRAVNVGELNEAFNDGDEISLEQLRAALKGTWDEVKILGNGELSKKLKITAHRFSASAREKIEKAGGQAIELPGKKPVVRNKQKSAKPRK